MPELEINAERITRHANMIEYLSALYDVPLYQRGDTRYPVYVQEPDSSQITDIDSVCGPMPTEPKPQPFEIYNHAHLSNLQNSGRNLFNGVTYALRRIRTRPLQIEAYIGRYFDMLATCDALKRELYDAAYRRYIRLPLRAQYHRSMGPVESLTNGMGRSAAIGGATLVVFNRQGTYQAMLAQRSRQNATDPGFYHTVPAFIYQPRQVPFHADEWRISYHIYREYLEELFGMPEVNDSAPYDHFYQHPALLDLQAMLANGEAGLYLTGIVHDLTMLRPEITALLLIHDEAWYERVTAPDSPIPLNAHAETDDGQLLTFPIEQDERIYEAVPNPHLSMPPQGAVAMWLGIEMARKQIQAYKAKNA
ncbi:hypothetical protein G4Y79_22105 [Phototrophicus methaneseepsis]|uniref:Uncharacterized protein n=1 Tax=Phototrophicus methaneseepsis TaxID=2710758 RepID=A0A7S8E8H2_9CHLR|nr:hypothetical protein [Phototrophicus methaneseepsis]QPC82345.1 hypothetical protein G4Y79_22105 [Phototrophicus methaneseepsis]